MSSCSCYEERNEGVPIGCHSDWCPLDHKSCCNTSSLFYAFGTIGVPLFDKHRKIFFGVASISAILLMPIAIYGTLALSTDPELIKATYWIGGRLQDTSKVYIGLQSFSYMEGGTLKSIDYGSEACQNNLMFASTCDSCQDVSIQLYLTTLGGCIGLILAFFNSQTRMRVVADFPIQKVMGVVIECLCTLAFVFALILFQNNCIHSFQTDANIDIQHQYTGPGIYCFAVCATFTGLRALLQWLTPLPGQDFLCCCQSNVIILNHRDTESKKQQQKLDRQRRDNELYEATLPTHHSRITEETI